MSTSLTKVVDKSGRSIWLRPFCGTYASPQFNQMAVENMTSFPLREDDVMLVSYPKAGCHWAWEILRILVTGDIDNKGLDKEDYMMEWREAGEFTSLASPRILNNHMPFHLQPIHLLEKRPKIVLFYRNLKDVAVSFFHHHSSIKEYEYKGDDFRAYLDRLVDGLVDLGNPFKFHKEWDEAINKHPELQIYCCAFEDMKENPVSEMRKVGHFLGKDYDDNFLQLASNSTNFDHMKQTKGANNPIFYRKGQVGDWKNHFTVANNEWFDGLIQSEMAGISHFNFRYSIV